MAGEHRGETADGVDILLDLGEPRVDDLADIVEFGARVGFPAAVLARREEAGRLVVMPVLDVADDFLDQILDRDETLGARIFVASERQMEIGRASCRDGGGRYR